jgi:hypothetical protein
MTPKMDNSFQMQVFAQQLELLIRMMKDLKEEMALVRKLYKGVQLQIEKNNRSYAFKAIKGCK